MSRKPEIGEVSSGPRGKPIIHCPLDPNLLGSLAEQASAEGYGMVSKLLDEWKSGRNRFDRPGERSYLAVLNGIPCGVCGLNIDPFVGAAEVGRVRRLYVTPTVRRMGIGSALVRRLLSDSIAHFGVLRVRTREVAASAFYQSLGFECVVGDPLCTHQWTNVRR